MPSWLQSLPSNSPIAYAIGMLALASLVGMAVGGLKFRGIGLGVAGVLFAGITLGHFSEPVDSHVLEFTREFGLILFVFTIGLQLGPGFFSALRREGLKLNALAVAIVLGGAAIAPLTAKLLGIDFAAALGLLSGATTNTPSLGAAQQALATLPEFAAERAVLPALAYAVAYPVGIAGIIASMLLLRAIFRIDPVAEAARFYAAQQASHHPLERRSLVVENLNLDGVAIRDIPGREETGVAISRIRSAGSPEVRAATGATTVRHGDTLLAVGTARSLDQFQRVVGRRSEEDLMQVPSQVTFRRVAVTRKSVLGKTVAELGLDHLFGVAVTRITRADLELGAVPNLRLQFGDSVQLVGEERNLEAASKHLGGSLKELNETQFVPLFTGILLGVLLGMLPISLPGVSQPVRLGLAGGPLIVAILVGRLGHLGPLVWHMPPNANIAFRELGITLFLAAVGLKAGGQFFETVFTSTGLLWMLAAACITVIPLMAVGIFARVVMKLNFMTLTGLLAGSTTDPPALAFAGNISQSDAPSVSYATVYPLTMLLRIVCAQGLALALCG